MRITRNLGVITLLLGTGLLLTACGQPQAQSTPTPSASTLPALDAPQVTGTPIPGATVSATP